MEGVGTEKLCISLCFGSLVKNIPYSWTQPCYLLFREVVKTDSQTYHCWGRCGGWRWEGKTVSSSLTKSCVFESWKCEDLLYGLASVFFFFIKTSIKRQLIAFNAALNFLWAGFSLSRMVPSQDSSAVLQLLRCFLGYLSSQGWSCS